MTDWRRGGRSPSAAGAELGSATLLSALWIVVLVLLAAAGIVLATAFSARSRADAAADLGALAGASAVLEGPEAVCTRARHVVAANGAALVSCVVRGAQVRVEVTAPAPRSAEWLLPGRGSQMRARAHAELTRGGP